MSINVLNAVNAAREEKEPLAHVKAMLNILDELTRFVDENGARYSARNSTTPREHFIQTVKNTENLLINYMGEGFIPAEQAISFSASMEERAHKFVKAHNKWS